jgi:hypothetical protein
MFESYWRVRLDACAFDTKKEALAFQHALEKVFMSMPESVPVAASFFVYEITGVEELEATAQKDGE